jgi:hypothetical protein
MMKRRARQNKAIDQRHRHAQINFPSQRAQHSAGPRTVDDQVVTDARVTGRNHDRLIVGDEPYVTDKTFIEDCVDDFTIETTAFWQTL